MYFLNLPQKNYGFFNLLTGATQTQWFTGQPLPNDDDLRKDNLNRVPAEARRIMEEMGIDPSFENNVTEDD